MRFLAIILLFSLYLSCSKNLIMNCSRHSYFSSDYHRENTSFLKTQRDLFTTFSEEQMDEVFTSTGLSCKEVLSRYFYCNICFNQSADFLIAYNGKNYELKAFNSAFEYTDSLIRFLTQMQMGREEYDIYLIEN